MADPASDDLDPLLDSNPSRSLARTHLVRSRSGRPEVRFSPVPNPCSSELVLGFVYGVIVVCHVSMIDRSDGDGDGGEGRATLPSMASAPPVQGLGMGLPDLGARRKDHQRAQPGGSHASEALEKLTQLTREAVRGLESATGAAVPRDGDAGFDDDRMVDELVKQFEELAGSQQLLSKEILHEPMREIGERYPKWLEEHKDDLNQEEYDRYYRQSELILKLNDVYENDPENFSKVTDLMQTIQECGDPPGDIVQELAPDLDLSNFSQL
ncbi:hypothetical protein GW17_00002517 [Ensete ventricosum]|nr:hypothetical protein GW17_00002517 [Ensete ventricosum]RZR78593.1 hypothetical protein BHM03_00004008 [Ensete ventricosum]